MRSFGCEVFAALTLSVTSGWPALSQSTNPCGTATLPDCLRQLVDEQLAKEVAHLKEQGFGPSHRTRSASIAKGRSEPFQIDLTAGVEYAFINACETDLTT